MFKDKNVMLPLNLATSTDKLKELILEHPDYPIVVVAGQDACNSDYPDTYCSKIHCEIGMILDCETPYTNEEVMTDEDGFREKIEDCLASEAIDAAVEISDDDFYAAVDAEVAKYQPFWKDVIFIYADN